MFIIGGIPNWLRSEVNQFLLFKKAPLPILGGGAFFVEEYLIYLHPPPKAL